MRALEVLLLGALTASCGGAYKEGNRPAPPPHLACQPGERTAAETPIPTEGEEVKIGQMTEKAAEAKRLYDREDWIKARPALLSVMRGETQDDDGNRQIAQYFAAICAYRMDDHLTALKEMAPIAQNAFHLKHASSLLWIAKLSHDVDLSVQAIDLIAGYAPEIIDKFKNPQQQELWEQVAFMHGRSHYRRGDNKQARIWLSRVGADSRYHKLAQDCLALAK